MIGYKTYSATLGFFIGFSYPEGGKEPMGKAYSDDALGDPIEVKCVAVNIDGKKTVTRWAYGKYKPAEYPGDVVPNKIAKAINAYGHHDVIVMVSGSGLRKAELTAEHTKRHAEPEEKPKKKAAGK